MGRFQATVRILDVTEPDAPTAMRTVEERLHKAGFDRLQLVGLHPQGVRVSARRPRRRTIRRESSDSGRAILVGVVVALALWLLWLIVD